MHFSATSSPGADSGEDSVSEELLESSIITGSSPAFSCVSAVASAAWLADPPVSEPVGTTMFCRASPSLPQASVFPVAEGNMFDLDESGRKLP